MMELEGYEVRIAADCKSGLHVAATEIPEVILCDVCLPDGNGVEMIAALKKTLPLSEVILLTAYGNIPDGVQAIKNGAFDYITKGDDNRKIPIVSRAMKRAQLNLRFGSVPKTVEYLYFFDSILGESATIKNAISLALKVPLQMYRCS